LKFKIACRVLADSSAARSRVFYSSIPSVMANFASLCKTCVQNRDIEAVKVLWKRKHFEERSWKRKQTRKYLTF